ncbi:hypothetical protein [Candidatus Electrothrix sp.]|uniref:hypothetical protein n=1 Tax=Candidatus Electrothrix sp. TaxID=2170559 RepID=UPI0040574C06
MEFKPLKDRLDSLPLILAGPIVRRTEPKQVTVWVALKEPCKVTLRIYGEDENARLVEIFSGTTTTISLGYNLHLTAVTARKNDEQDSLAWGGRYYYNLFFDEVALDGLTENNSPVDELDEKSLKGGGILETDLMPVDISYDSSGLPSFVLPEKELKDLRIIHSSCRKPHGEGEDMLAKVDELIDEAVKNPSEIKRPQQLFLTGDQIYADDVAPTMLAMLMDASEALIDWKEKLPGIEIDDEGLLPNNRQKFAEEIAKLTAGDVSGNHLFTVGEYWMMYLFVWSKVLWDQNVWNKEEFDNETDQRIYNLYKKLSRVRKALANISTYMICDDHEITDDWFLNLQWCVDVFGSQLGRRILLNGMLGYALFQAWGNDPDQFEWGNPDGAGYQFLEAVQKWRPIGDIDLSVQKALELALGIADADMVKKIKEARSLHVIHENAEALSWHYHVPGSKYQVIVLDTRTWRYFPGDPVEGDADELEDGNNAPALLGKEALDAQILPYKPVDNPFEITFVVSAAPVIAIEWASEYRASMSRFGGKLLADYEDWEYQKDAVWQLFATLSTFGPVSTISGEPHNLSRIIFLSGDVHYGYTSKIDYQRKPLSGNPELKKGAKSIFTQLNSSALKNQDIKTKHAQFVGYKQKKYILPFWDKKTNASYEYAEHIVANRVEQSPLNCPGGSRWDIERIRCIASGIITDIFGDETDDEIIGRNNIGEVYFSNDSKRISQILHWKDDDNEKHSSHYVIELDFNPA